MVSSVIAAAHRLRKALAVAAALPLLLVGMPLLNFIGTANAANPDQVQMTLEGCNRSSPAERCTYSTGGQDDFTTGDLGKNWSELDYVPHRLTLVNNGADQTFQIRLSADHMLKDKLGYDRYRAGWDTTFNTAAAPMFSSGCGSASVVESNVVSPSGVVGGVDTVLTDLLEVHMAPGATCLVSYEVRLGIGAHLYPGSSLQTQVLDKDYTSTGQRTVSIPVKEIAPQQVTSTASATHVTNYDWTIEKDGSDPITINSCLPPATTPNVHYTVTYTRTADPATDYMVTGKITLTNPSLLTLTTASITDTVTNGTSSYKATIDYPDPSNPHIVVPAATSAGAGTASVDFHVAIPGPLSSPTNSVTVTYQDPDDQAAVLDALTSSATPVSIGVKEQTGTGATASLSDTESFLAGGTGLAFQRTAPKPMSDFAESDTFTQSALDGNGSFTIDKIVKATHPENGTGTLHNVVKLTPEGQKAQTATADVPVTVTAAKPTITIHKTVDIAPTSDATFSFVITSKSDQAKSWKTSVTIPAGQKSASSAPVTVDPSASGYTIGETPAPGYSGVATDAPALGLCDTYTGDVSNTRNLGHVRVTKLLSGPVAGADSHFDFAVSCPTIGYTTTLHVVGANSAQTADVIPTGTACTITETGVPAGWKQTSSVPSDGGVTAKQANGPANTVTVTNTRVLGRIQVTKALAGDVAGAPTAFTFGWTCAATDGTYSGSGQLSVNGAGSVQTDKVIPVGVPCTITETNIDAHWSLTSTSPQNGTVISSESNGSADTVTFTNTRKTGVITVNKSLVGDPTGASTSFTFHVDCPATAYDQDLAVDIASGSSGSATTGQIPTGLTCTVTENASPGWSSTVTPSNGQATVPGSVAFTNSRDTGVITVTKTTSGAVAGASTVFTFDIVCPANPAYDQTVTLDSAKAKSATSGAIPTGLVCTVTERSTAGWQQTAPVQGGVDVTVPGTAGFENSRLTGPLQLAKSVTPKTGSYGKGKARNTLTYTLRLSPTGALDHTDVVVTDYIPGYDPSDTASGTTTYVAGSATCSTGCTATYDAAHHLLSWAVGDVNHDAAAVVLTFKVTIDTPTYDKTVGLPAEVVDNIGFVRSTQQAKTPSNQVKTPVPAILPVKVVKPKPQPKQLPFTGLPIPAQLAVWSALLMIGTGAVLTSVRRRRKA